MNLIEQGYRLGRCMSGHRACCALRKVAGPLKKRRSPFFGVQMLRAETLPAPERAHYADLLSPLDGPDGEPNGENSTRWDIWTKRT